MNLSPGCRSQPHNLLLVGLTEGKPKNLDKILNRFGALGDFAVGDQVWRPIISFVSADLPALADCARGIAPFSGVLDATWLPHAWAPASVTWATIVFPARPMLPRKNHASAQSNWHNSISPSSPHTGAP